MVKKTIAVFDNDGRYLSHCTYERAKKLRNENKATFIGVGMIKLTSGRMAKLKEKHRVIEEDNRICYICNKIISIKKQATVDHVIPKSRDEFADIKMNERCCCVRCNNDKDCMTLSEYVKHIRRNRSTYPYLSEKRLTYLEQYAKQHENDYYNLTRKYLKNGGEFL
jgi:hypothetical protein